MTTALARLPCVVTSNTAAPPNVDFVIRRRSRAPMTQLVPTASAVRSRIRARVRLAWANAPPHAQRPAARSTSSALAPGIADRNRAPPGGPAWRAIAAPRPELQEQIHMAVRPCPALRATRVRAAPPAVPTRVLRETRTAARQSTAPSPVALFARSISNASRARLALAARSRSVRPATTAIVELAVRALARTVRGCASRFRPREPTQSPLSDRRRRSVQPQPHWTCDVPVQNVFPVPQMHAQLGTPSHPTGNPWQLGLPGVLCAPPKPTPLHAARQYWFGLHVTSPHETPLRAPPAPAVEPATPLLPLAPPEPPLPARPPNPNAPPQTKHVS